MIVFPVFSHVAYDNGICHGTIVNDTVRIRDPTHLL